jgi:hypothetical protein
VRRHDTQAIWKKTAMTASGDPHPLSPGMPPACKYEVRAKFDQFAIREDFVADLAGNTSHRLLEFQPQVTINTKGQLELHLAVPGPDVWTSLLTAMAVIRQSGYAPIAILVFDNSESTTTPTRHLGNDSNQARFGKPRPNDTEVGVIRRPGSAVVAASESPAGGA